MRKLTETLIRLLLEQADSEQPAADDLSLPVLPVWPALKQQFRPVCGEGHLFLK